MMRHRVHVLHRDRIAPGVGRDLFDLGDQTAHQIAADKDQTLRRLHLHALAHRVETARDPVDQCILRLLREFQILCQLPQRLDVPEPSVRLAGGVLDEGHGAVVGDVAQQLQHFIRLGTAIEIHIADLHERPLRQEGHGVQRV